MENKEEIQKVIDKKGEIYAEISNKILKILANGQVKYKLHPCELLGILEIIKQFILKDKKTGDINIIQLKKAKDEIDRITDYFGNVGQGG